MVDTTDSKSVAGNRVRVQVSLPVKGLKVFLDLFFAKNHNHFYKLYSALTDKTLRLSFLSPQLLLYAHIQLCDTAPYQL